MQMICRIDSYVYVLNVLEDQVVVTFILILAQVAKKSGVEYLNLNLKFLTIKKTESFV